MPRSKLTGPARARRRFTVDLWIEGRAHPTWDDLRSGGPAAGEGCNEYKDGNAGNTGSWHAEAKDGGCHHARLVPPGLQHTLFAVPKLSVAYHRLWLPYNHPRWLLGHSVTAIRQLGWTPRSNCAGFTSSVR